MRAQKKKKRNRLEINWGEYKLLLEVLLIIGFESKQQRQHLRIRAMLLALWQFIINNYISYECIMTPI
jgi:hypothetical protein